MCKRSCAVFQPGRAKCPAGRNHLEEEYENPMDDLVMLLALACSGRANAQSSGCTFSFNDGDVTCTVGSCEQSITTQTPNGGYGYYAQGYSCTTVQCCGQGSYPFCYFDGGQCYWTKLKDPSIRQNLLELAQTEDLLVVSCKGNYQPLMAVLNEEAMPVFRVRSSHRFNDLVGGGQ